MTTFRILILGGYGQFGARIASALARACLDFFSLDEFLCALDGYAVTTQLEVVGQALCAATSQHT